MKADICPANFSLRLAIDFFQSFYIISEKTTSKLAKSWISANILKTDIRSANFSLRFIGYCFISKFLCVISEKTTAKLAKSWISANIILLCINFPCTSNKDKSDTISFTTTLKRSSSSSSSSSSYSYYYYF